ncbi:MAG: hypothetical protein LBR19_04855, partial [Bifidobacteriaceae bacterium]|nr:hypothetical protein [Bifidobacteriaceae bacterium]
MLRHGLEWVRGARRHARRHPRRRVALLAITAGVLVLGLGLTAVIHRAADAAPQGYVAPYTWVSGNFGNGNGGTYLGRLVNTDTSSKAVAPYAFCITAGAASPIALQDAGTRTGGIYSQMGFVLGRHSGETGDLTPQAISYLAHLYFDTGNNQSADTSRALIRQNTPKATSGPAIVARAEALWAEAALLMGQPKLSLSLGTLDQAAKTMPVRIELRNAAGTKTMSAPVTLTLTRTAGTGQATFVASKSYKVTVNTVAVGSTLQVPVTFTGTGSWRIDAATTAQFPGNAMRVLSQPGHQTAVAAVAQVAATPAAASFTVGANQAVVTTKASAQGKAAVGDTVTDTVTISGGWPGDTLTVTAALWKVSGPGTALPGQTVGVPTGARLLYTAPAVAVKLNAQGAGSISAGRYTIKAADGAGWYTWRVSTAATAWTKAATHNFSVAAESFQVLQAKATISSRAMVPGGAVPGQAASDQVTLKAGWPGDTLTVKATLVRLPDDPAGPAPKSSAARPAGAVDVAGPFTKKVTLDAQGAATITVGNYTLGPDDLGWLTWRIETTNSTSGNTAGRQAPYGMASETFLVTQPQGPTVTTQASSAVAEPGQGLSDQLLVDAHGANLAAAPAVIESTLWGPFQTPPTTSPNWPQDESLVVGTVLTTANRAGTFTSPALTVTERGYYTWTARVRPVAAAVYTPALSVALTPGAGGSLSVLGAATGLPGGVSTPATVQLFRLGPDGLATGGSEVAVPAGGAVTLAAGSDGVRGWAEVAALPAATLAGGDGWYGVRLAVPAGDSAAGDGRVEAASSGLEDPLAVVQVTTQDDGSLTFGFGADGTAPGVAVADLPRPAASEAQADQIYPEFVSAFGEAAETTVVPWSPRVVTQTSLAVASPGAELTDRLELTGGHPGTAYQITSVLYGPLEARPELAAAAPAGTPVAGSVVTAVVAGPNGSAVATTPAVMVDTQGYYVWVESIPEDLEAAASRGWQGQFGVAQETTVVPYAPALRSDAVITVAEPGGQAHDELFLSGGRPGASGTLEVALYGPFTDSPVRDYGPADQATDGDQASGGDQVSDGDQAAGAAWTTGEVQAGEDTAAGGTGRLAGNQGEDLAEDPGEDPSENPAEDPADSGPGDIGQAVGAPPAEAPEVQRFTTEVEFDEAGGAQVQTPPVTLTEGGYYVYSGVFTPAGDDLPTPERFGEASETLFVPWRPDIQTRASAEVAVVGAALTDHLAVRGLGRETAEVEALLYGPFATQPEPAAEVPADAPLAGRVHLTVTGDGNYTTPAVRVSLAGYYTWVERVAAGGEGRVLATATEFGLVEETTLVTPYQPEVTTKASSLGVSPGAVIFDTGQVTGLPPLDQPVTIVTTLYGPFEAQPELAQSVPADAPVAGQVEVEVMGDGEYTTPGVVVNQPGYYVWVEAIEPSLEDGLAGFSGRFGVVAETTLVNPPEPEA